MTAIVLSLLALVAGAPATAARGGGGPGLHVAALSCVTANTHVAGRRGCATVPGAGYEGSEFAGIDAVTALATTGTGTSLYAVSDQSSALTQLRLSTPRQLSFVGCVTGNSFLDGCSHLPGATANAVEAPLAEPTGLAISPDGRSLYAVGGDFHSSVLARFARDPASGALTYEGCLTSDLKAGPAGPGACAALPGATADGFHSDLYEASGIAIDASGTHAYVTASGGSALTTFSRDPASGALSFASCLSSEPRVAACSQTPGGNDILEGLSAPLLSPDGRFLYAGAGRAGTLSVFALAPAGPRFAGCVTSRDDAQPCGRGRPGGPLPAMTNPSGLAGSVDGRFLYAASTGGSIVALRRNSASGALEATSCISSNAEDRGRCATVPAIPKRTKGTHHATLLTGARTPLLASAKTVLAPIRTIDGLVELNRNPKTGALAFRGCASADLTLSAPGKGPCQRLPGATGNGSNSGFYKTTALIPAPGGRVYAAASGDATVSVLRP